MSESIDHLKLYRLPWSLPDNTIAWLEPTSKCNLYCEGCYRENVDEHKTLAQVADELDVFARYRNFDGVSIAGGDPLLHPQIVDIVRMVKDRGYKPVLNTNGHALTEDLLRDLKKAGLTGFTFHIDSKQSRPHWKGSTEQDLNALRLSRAEMVACVGGLSCAFNSTVYEDTLKDVPDLVAWAQEHIDIVHVMVFIIYRAAVLNGDYDYFADGRQVDMSPLAYSYPSVPRRTDISAQEVVGVIRERFPEFAPSAYLNGTEKADSFKWLLTSRLGTAERIYGYAGPKSMELIQAGYHLLTGRYLAYASPSALGLSKLLLALAPFDAGLRQVAKRVLFDPRMAFRRLHYQSIAIIQPIDILEDGRQNMCDGCPDMTVWDKHLAWSCRLEECRKFGQFVNTAPKKRVVPEGGTSQGAPPGPPTAATGSPPAASP